MRKKLLLGLGSMLCLASMATAKPMVIGHRGASAHAPENTTVAMQLAWDLNADGAEFDVWGTNETDLLVIHDDTTSRTGLGVNKYIHRSKTEELRKVDVGAWRGRWFAKTKIPTIDEVFAIHPEKKRYVIEFKTRKDINPHAIPNIKKAIEKTGRSYDDFVFICFNFEACVQARKLMPEIDVLFLYSSQKDDKGNRLPYDESLLKRVKDANLTGVNVAFDGVNGPEIVKKAHDMGLKFFVWTVNDASIMQKMTDYGVDGITTDLVDVCRKIVDKKK